MKSLSRTKFEKSYLLTYLNALVSSYPLSLHLLLYYSRAISELESLILDLRRIGVQREVWKRRIFRRRIPPRELLRIQTPQGAENGDIRQRFIDEILVCACKLGVDDPVQISFCRREADVDV
jgi:hypothetical protein